MSHIFSFSSCLYSSGEKRKHEDSTPSTEVEPKKGRIEGDVSAELVNEIIATITDPNEMVGPDVIIAWVIVSRTRVDISCITMKSCHLLLGPL